MLLIMSWGNNDLINDYPWGMIAIKLCPGITFFLLVIHRGYTVINYKQPNFVSFGDPLWVSRSIRVLVQIEGVTTAYPTTTDTARLFTD